MANLLGWATHTDCDLHLQQREPKEIKENGGGVNMRQKNSKESRERDKGIEGGNV